MKILFVSPAIEEKSRGIGAIFRSLVESAHKDGHDVSVVLGYPEVRPFQRSDDITGKLEHLYAQHYIQDGRDSYKSIAKRKRLKIALLEGLLSFSFLRSKTIDVDEKYLQGPPTILNDCNQIVKSPFFYVILNYLPASLSQLILNRIIRKNNIDMVVMSAPTTISNKRTPALVAHFVHDVMPLELVEAPPDNNTPRRYAKQFYSACKNSDIIFTNSQDTSLKVLDTNPEANVHVLYGTASSHKEDVGSSDILKRKKLQKGKYLLFTSTVEKRKNVSNLMKAYARIHDEVDMPLVIVGGQGYGYDQIIKTYKKLDKEVQRKIHFLGYVSEADKFALFDNAFAFVFPSVYEGMGLMLIEAMQADIPIITSRRGALTEAGGDAAYYIENPYDVEEIAQAILTVYHDPKLLKELVRNGKQQRKKFTFEKFTERFSKSLASLKNKEPEIVTTDAPVYSRKFAGQLLEFNFNELFIVGLIFLNQFSYWPTLAFDGLGGFSLEVTMVCGLALIARGLYVFRAQIIQQLLGVRYFWILYAWWLYGTILALTQSTAPEIPLVKSLYLLTVLVGVNVIGALYVNKKISAGNIIKGWVLVALLMAPVFIAQYLLVTFGFDTFSKRAYQVSIFPFPRLHGFAFEPLYLANWLLVPTVFTVLRGPATRHAATILSLLVFLSLARGAIYALLAAILLYVIIMRPGARTVRDIFKPVFRGFVIAMLFVGFSAQINNSTFLQGTFRYLDHLTLGVFNEGGASNVSFITVERDGEEIEVVNVKEIDRTGVVEGSSESRRQAIEVGRDMFEDHPITGVGLFRFGEEANERIPEIYGETGTVANSQPVDIVAETGLIGVALLLAFVFMVRKQIFNRNLLTIVLFALSVQFLFFTALFPLAFWIILVLIVVGAGKEFFVGQDSH